jgi:hypothetical protein
MMGKHDGKWHIISTMHGLEEAKRVAMVNEWDWRWCVYLPWGHSQELRFAHMAGIHGLRDDQLIGQFTREERAYLTSGGEVE